MNAAEVLLGQARARPDAPALVEPIGRGRAISFAELEAATARAAAMLRDDGVAPGDRVLVLHRMSIDLYVALIAVLRIGAVAVFLDPSAGAAHVERCCQSARPRAFIGSPRAHLLRLMCPALQAAPLKYTTAALAPGARRFAKWSAFAPEPSMAPVKDGHPALLTFTSGSTGEPKAAIRSHGFLLAQHRALAEAIDLRPGQIDLTTLPVFALANLASGVTSLIPDADLRRPGSIDPRPVLRQIGLHRPTRCAASPAFFERLLDAAPDTRWASFQRLDAGGAPVFPRLLERLRRAAPRARVVAVYGSTEAEPIAHVACDDITAADAEAMARGGGLLAGRPVPQIALRVIPNRWGRPIPALDERTFEAMCLAAGEPGEIVVSGAHVLTGYLGGVGDEETKLRVRDTVWHRTGDAGYLDAQGRLWLLGRAEARIRDDAGELYPFAVEAAASALADVRRSALIACGGRRVLAVEPRPGAEPGLDAAVRRTLPWAKLDEIRIVRRVPVDGRHNAKVDYPALRRLLGVKDPHA